jgi:hypothetical protein
MKAGMIKLLRNEKTCDLCETHLTNLGLHLLLAARVGRYGYRWGQGAVAFPSEKK